MLSANLAFRVGHLHSLRARPPRRHSVSSIPAIPFSTLLSHPRSQSLRAPFHSVIHIHHPHSVPASLANEMIREDLHNQPPSECYARVRLNSSRMEYGLLYLTVRVRVLLHSGWFADLPDDFVLCRGAGKVFSFSRTRIGHADVL